MNNSSNSICDTKPSIPMAHIYSLFFFILYLPYKPLLSYRLFGQGSNVPVNHLAQGRQVAKWRRTWDLEVRRREPMPLRYPSDQFTCYIKKSFILFKLKFKYSISEFILWLFWHLRHIGPPPTPLLDFGAPPEINFFRCFRWFGAKKKRIFFLVQKNFWTCKIFQKCQETAPQG